MDNRGFYEAVLPVREDAFYILWEKDGSRTHPVSGFEKFVERVQHTGTDWYYATAAYSAPQRKNDNVVAVKSFRLDLDAGPDKYDPENPEKAYESQEDAVKAFVAFTKATGFTPSYVVSSGYGLHVYYALDKECTDLDEWVRIARSLHTWATEHLRVDASVTTDRGRLLRPPGSTHYSGKTVTILAQSARVYTLDEVAKVVGTVRAPSWDTSAFAGAAGVNDDVTVTYEQYPASFKQAAQHCLVLKRAMEEPEKLSYDEWFGSLIVAKSSIEGAEIAHEFSSRDAARYDKYALDQKLATITADFITCENMRSPLCASCEFFGKIRGPRELGRLTTQQMQAQGIVHEPAIPAMNISAVNEQDRAMLEEFPDLQSPFYVQWDEVGGTHQPALMVTVNKKSKSVLGGETTDVQRVVLTRDLFYVASWVDASEGSNVAYMLRVRSRDGFWSEHPMPSAYTADRKALLTFLSQRGVHPRTNTVENGEQLHRYVMNLIDAIKNRAQRPAPRTRLGFQYNNRKESVYVQGRYAIMPNGNLVRALPTPNFRQFTPSFTIDAIETQQGDALPADSWARLEHCAGRFTEGLRLMYEGRPLYQAALLFGMASMFMAFTVKTGPRASSGSMPEVGGVLSLYSAGSGYGKTTLQELIAAAYYEPSKLKQSGDAELSGSGKATIIMCSLLGSMPMIMDEVTENDAAYMAKLVYKLSSGKDAISATSERTLRSTNDWSNITIMSTNKSQREMLAAHRAGAEATQMRLLELDFDTYADQVGEGGIGDYGRWWREYISPNIGALSLVVAREAMRVGYEGLTDAAEVAATGLQKKYGLKNAERYSIQMAAAAQLMHLFLSRLGFVFYDYDAVMQIFASSIAQLRDFLVVNRPSQTSMIAEMLREFYPNMYVSENEQEVRGRVSEGVSQRGEFAIQKPRGAAVGRFVIKGRYAYVAVEAVREWCKENNTTLGGLERRAFDEGVLIQDGAKNGLPNLRMSRSLTKGLINEPTLRATCWKIDLARLNFDIESPVGDNVIPLTGRSDSTESANERADSAVSL